MNLLTVAEIKASEKLKLRDGAGLWLHTSKAGGRYWVFIFTRNGRRREMGLGSYGAGTGSVTLASARIKANEIRAILGRGGDPFTDLAERQGRQTSATFGMIVDEYIAAMSGKWRGKQTLPAWMRFASNYTKPLRKLPIADISTDDIVRILRPLWDGKPETATKVRERIKIVLDHARARGLRTGDNPAAWKGHLDQILPPPKKLVRGHHAAMPYVDIPPLMQRLRESEAIGANALAFVVLTAARSGEVRGARWEEIDLDQRVWTIPSDRMKSGKLHRVPLSDQAIAILKAMKAAAINDFVFPGRRNGSPLSDMTLSKSLTLAGGGEFTVHGFRSGFRDWVAEETMHQREVAEAALAHSVGDAVERAYRRGDALTKRRKLMGDWAQYCTKVH